MRKRVEITDEEAATVGVTDETLHWPEKIRPLLMAKGLTAEEVTDYAPLQWWWDDSRRAMQFEVTRG